MKKLINKTFEIFSSLKFTIALLIIILIYLAVSTFIPQETEYLKFLSTNKPILFTLLKITGLLNPYHNFVVVFWLYLFTLNLIACTINRLPAILERLKRNIDPDYLPIDSLIKADVEINSESNNILEKIRRLYRDRVEEKEINCNKFLIIKKGKYASLNFLLVHLSILIIIIGISITSISGYEGFIRLTEGKTENLFYREVLKGNYIKMPLPFEIRLNKFSNVTLESGLSVDYISDVTVIDNEREFNTLIRVNEPLKYRGLLFVQSSYEQNLESAEFNLQIERSDEKKEITLKLGEEITIWEKKFFISDYFENVHNMGAAIKIKYGDDIIIALANKPEIQNEESDIRVYIKGIKIPYNSILRITSDYGTPLVFLGSTLFLLSLLLVIFYRFTLIAIRYGENKGIYYLGKKPESEINNIASILNEHGEKR